MYEQKKKFESYFQTIVEMPCLFAQFQCAHAGGWLTPPPKGGMTLPTGASMCFNPGNSPGAMPPITGGMLLNSVMMKEFENPNATCLKVEFKIEVKMRMKSNFNFKL